MLSAGVASLEKRGFDAFASSMSTVVQELYAGIPAAISSSERPACVLGANPDAFVLSCGGLPSEHQRTCALTVRGFKPPQTSLAGILAQEEEEGDTNRAQNGGNVNVSEETADIFEEHSVPKEEATLPTEEKREPSSNLPFAETSTSLHYLDEAKEKLVVENTKTQGGGALSGARDAFLNPGDELLFYGGEDFNTLSNNCARCDENGTGSDSPFGNAPWAEDVAEVVCTADKSNAESVETGALEEWCDGPKMEESVLPAWSCGDVYGGERKRRMDHSYSRRDAGGNMAEAQSKGRSVRDLNYLSLALEEFCAVSEIGEVPIVSAETDTNNAETADIFAPKSRVTQTLIQEVEPPLDKPLVGQSVITEVEPSMGQLVIFEVEPLKGQSVIPEAEETLDKPLKGQSVIPEVETPLDKPLMGQSVIPEVQPLVDKPSMGQLVIPEVEPSMGQSVISDIEPLVDKPSMGQLVIPEVQPLVDKPSMGQLVISEVETPLDKPLMGQLDIPEDEPSMGQLVIPEVQPLVDKPSMSQLVISEVEASLDEPSMGQSIIPEDEPSMGQLVIPEVEAPLDEPSMGQSVIPEDQPPLDDPSMGQSVIPADEPSMGPLVIPDIQPPLDKPSMSQLVISEVEAPLDKPLMGQSVIPEDEPSMGQLILPENESSMGQSVMLEDKPPLDEPSMDQSVIQADEPSKGQLVIPEDEPSMGQSVISEVEPLVDKPLMGQLVIPEVQPLVDKPSMSQLVISEVEASLDEPSMGQSVIPEDEPSMGQLVIPEVEASLDEPSMGQSVIREDELSMGQSVIPEYQPPLDDPSMGQSVIPADEPSKGQLVIPEDEPLMGPLVIPEVQPPLDKPSMGQSVIPEVEAPLDKPLMGQLVIPEDEPSMGQLVIPEDEAPLDKPLMGHLVIPEVQPLVDKPSMGQLVIPEVQPPLDEPSMGPSVICEVEPSMGQLVISEVEPSMGQSVISEVEPMVNKPFLGQSVIPQVEAPLDKSSMGRSVIPEVEPLEDNPLVSQLVIPQIEPSMGQLVILDVQPPVDKPLVSQSVTLDVETVVDNLLVSQLVIPKGEPKRPLKRRQTFEIGRHFGGASLQTALKTARWSPSSRSALDDTEHTVLRSSLAQTKRFRVGRAEAPTILREMSSLPSDRLFAPPRNAAPLSDHIAPEKYGHFRNKIVPKTFFSTATAKLRPPWIDANGGGIFEEFSSPSWIYWLESAAMFVFGVSRKTNFAFGPLTAAAMGPYDAKTVCAKSPWSVTYGSAWREETYARPPYKWSFAFVLSQSATPFHVAPLCADPDAAKDGRCAIARRHMSGLQTVMALLFPGCWRLLARKQRPPKRCTSVRRLAFLRFDGVSKDVDSSALFCTSSCSAFSSDLLPWDRLDPCSTPPSEIAPLSLPRCVESSTAALPTPRCGFALHDRWGLHFCPSFPTSPSIRKLVRSRLQLSLPELPPHPSDKPDDAVPVFPESDDAPCQEAESEEKKPKRVSQIRIRKTVPKPDPNLTPMGLPRPKRLKKTEFSLEEIYTNKNYKSPPATRSLETIFEEPKERNGSLVSVSHQKRKRVLEFQDFTIPRKRRAAVSARIGGRMKAAAAGGFTRAQKAASEGCELDGLLIQRLADIETFLAKQDGAAVAADAAGS